MTLLFESKQKAEEKPQILYLTPEIFWFWRAEAPELPNSNSLALLLNLGTVWQSSGSNDMWKGQVIKDLSCVQKICTWESPLYFIKLHVTFISCERYWYEQAQHDNLTERQKVKMVNPSVCQAKIKIFSEKVLYQTLHKWSHGTSEPFSVFPEIVQQQNQAKVLMQKQFLFLLKQKCTHHI